MGIRLTIGFENISTTLQLRQFHRLYRRYRHRSIPRFRTMQSQPNQEVADRGDVVMGHTSTSVLFIKWTIDSNVVLVGVWSSVMDKLDGAPKSAFPNKESKKIQVILHRLGGCGWTDLVRRCLISEQKHHTVHKITTAETGLHLLYRNLCYLEQFLTMDPQV